ncbi:MAG: hypothetical protein JNK15_12540 [Planctomycetes bacterium]|nr:hypothetical protein [Planctomycetota bacterium]
MVSAAERELLAAIEAGGAGVERFGHREHLLVTFVLLVQTGDLALAALRLRAALRRFAANRGVPGKYHETLTWAWLALVDDRRRRAPSASFDELLRAFPELLDAERGALADHYDVAAITRSERARAGFVLPGGGA